MTDLPIVGIESRLQMLSTLVLMGVNRIVVTGGKIRATMGFHIDTTDRAREEQASDFDFRTAVAGSFGFGPWSASASMSISYVSSTRSSRPARRHFSATDSALSSSISRSDGSRFICRNRSYDFR